MNTNVDPKARQGQSTIHKAITAIELEIEELKEVATWAFERGDLDEAENIQWAIGKIQAASKALRLCI